jgi:IS5 family transposase
LVNDAQAILDALEGVELDDDQQQLVALLALVAGQDVEPDPERGEGRWRIAAKVAPDRVVSTVDPESRHMHKSRSSYRDGFKAHVAVEPDTGLITGCDLTPANAGDGPVGARLLNGEEPGLQVLADSAYGSGDVRATLVEGGHEVVIKPIPLRRNPSLGEEQFNRDDFFIDYAARTATCPNGHTVAITAKGTATFGVRCRGCPLRGRCTSSRDGRALTIGEHDELLTRARSDWRAKTGLEDYRQHRPMVERGIAWLVADGHRRVRFRGVERNRLALSTRVAALNLRRLVNLGLHHGPAGWALA